MSAETSRESRLLAVKALASLPLVQLSTAGMELFHTNMLYWLATERPDESVAVWNAFGLPTARVGDQVPFIRQENGAALTFWSRWATVCQRSYSRTRSARSRIRDNWMATTPVSARRGCRSHWY